MWKKNLRKNPYHSIIYNARTHTHEEAALKQRK